MAGIYSQGGSAGHRYAGWLSEVEAKNFTFGGKVFNGSPSAIYVGSKMVWANWLTNATRQAIMDAFLDDGMAVIKATNAYLNQLAASDMDKATALAGFINEDPMMVCSLGLEVEGVTMPWRKFVTIGSVWFNSGYHIQTDQVVIKTKVQPVAQTAGEQDICGTFSSGNNIVFGYAGQNNNFLWNRNMNNASAAWVIDEEYDYVLTFDGANRTKSIERNGSVVGTNSFTNSIINANADFAFLAGGVNYCVAPSGTRCTGIELIDGGVQGVWLVPFMDGNTAKCMDLKASLETGTKVFLTPQGTGQFTIPDISYTPSTP